MPNKKFTLITGASTGLGKQLAIECAKLGRNLILTALHDEQISELGDKISSDYGIRVQTYETDLTEEGAVKKIGEEISEEFEIDMLINNAGIGGTKPFLEATTEYIDQIVLLNIRAMVLLTRLLLPNLKKQKKAYIL